MQSAKLKAPATYNQNQLLTQQDNTARLWRLKRTPYLLQLSSGCRMAESKLEEDSREEREGNDQQEEGEEEGDVCADGAD